MLGQFIELAFSNILSGHADSPNRRTIGELLEYIVFRPHRGVPQGTRIRNRKLGVLLYPASVYRASHDVGLYTAYPQPSFTDGAIVWNQESYTRLNTHSARGHIKTGHTGSLQ